MTESAKKKGSAISRVLEIVELVSSAKHPMSPADLAFHLDIPKPSIHRFLQQLEAEGYLQTNMRGMIVPAKRLHDIALGVLYSGRFKASRQAILKKLTHTIGETCGISIPDGTEMIYYDRIQSNWPLQINLTVGSHTPAWCTASGKLYLSSLAPARRKRIIEQLPLQKIARNTLSNPEQLSTALVETSTQGYAIDNEEFIDGMAGVAVPIMDKDNRLFACLFAHAPILRTDLSALLTFLPEMKMAAQELGTLIAESTDSENAANESTDDEY